MRLSYADTVNDGAIQQLTNTPEGYVKEDGDSFDYVYQYKDHLGNVRLSYSDTNNNGTIDSTTEIIEESSYYPFGLEHRGYNNVVSSNGNSLAQKRKFGGNELQDELGLEWYDITARNYDPAIGRWMNLDPLAEQMRRHSPYNYAFDNPIYWIDPDGMSPSSSCCKNQDPDDPPTEMDKHIPKIDFSPSDKTKKLLSEGVDFLAEAFDFGASVKSKIGIGGGVKIGGVDVKAEANIITGEISTDSSDKTTYKTKLGLVDLNGSLSIGPKDSDASIKASGSFKVADMNASIDSDGNVDGSIEEGGFDGSFSPGVGDEVNMNLKDLSTVGVSGKLGVFKASASVNLYNLSMGVSKLVEGGAQWLSEIFN